jgi:hypothetical protein
VTDAGTSSPPAGDPRAAGAKTRRRPTFALLAAGALVVAGWAVALVVLPYPPVAVSAVFATACVLAMLAARTTPARAVWFNVAFVIGAVGAFDAWVGRRSESTAEKQQTFGNSGFLFVRDDTFGVRPQPGTQTTAAMTWRGLPVYDVTYTFDETGLRISPPAPPSDSMDGARACVLFFGCSYTFGEGVEDDETMPYRVGVRAGGRAEVRNFGYSGYGPHQMLAALESGFAERAAGCRPTHVVYQAVYHHVVRAAGIWIWDSHGPRYVLGPDGRAVRHGNFDSEPNATAALAALEKSAVAIHLRKRGMDVGAGDATEEDVALFHAIVDASRRLVAEKWPGASFHVIHWDTYEALGRWPLFEGPDAEGLTVHPISRMLPPVEDPDAAYKLPHDVHPNPRAHDLIAAYVAEQILGMAPADAPQASARLAD